MFINFKLFITEMPSSEGNIEGSSEGNRNILYMPHPLIVLVHPTACFYLRPQPLSTLYYFDDEMSVTMFRVSWLLLVMGNDFHFNYRMASMPM